MIKAAVLGKPIGHSLSPIVHGFIYQNLDLGYEYSKIELDGEGALKFLPKALEERGSDGYSWSGFSLTMPLKEVGFDLDLKVDSYARRSISINTIIRGKGFNTDVTGALRVLQERKISPKKVLIMGNGATARSMVIVIEELSEIVKESISITIARRNSNKDQFFTEKNNGDMEFILISELSSHSLQSYDLVISTLPAGAADSIAEIFEGYGGAIFDLSYQPWPSVIAGNARGAVISGIDLLVAQAVDQAAIFSGMEFDRDLIFRQTLLSTKLYVKDN
jgi:shikimate dehydrogenase